jgi:hypothetical protein
MRKLKEGEQLKRTSGYSLSPEIINKIKEESDRTMAPCSRIVEKILVEHYATGVSSSPINIEEFNEFVKNSRKGKK